MQLLDQQKTNQNDLSGIIKSNVSTSERKANSERLREGIKTTKVPDVYFECPPVRNLTCEEREQILLLTFQMGNRLFYNQDKEETHPEFVHSYSTRFIEVDDKMIEQIEKYCNSTVYCQSPLNL